MILNLAAATIGSPIRPTYNTWSAKDKCYFFPSFSICQCFKLLSPEQSIEYKKKNKQT